MNVAAAALSLYPQRCAQRLVIWQQVDGLQEVVGVLKILVFYSKSLHLTHRM
jgi:hypothetical protein